MLSTIRYLLKGRAFYEETIPDVKVIPFKRKPRIWKDKAEGFCPVLINILKQKIKAAAEEAQYIKSFEVNNYTPKLHYMRTVELRQKTRDMLLAYGYLRGVRYKEIEEDPRWRRENHDRPEPSWYRIRQYVWGHSKLSENLPTYKDENISTLDKEKRMDTDLFRAYRDLEDKITLWKGN